MKIVLQNLLGSHVHVASFKVTCQLSNSLSRGFCQWRSTNQTVDHVLNLILC